MLHSWVVEIVEILFSGWIWLINMFDIYIFRVYISKGKLICLIALTTGQ